MLCVVCVFFFKQKTAYEMRISDWSSDVCSSDLAELLFDEAGAVRGVVTGDMGVARDGSHTDQYQPGMELLGSYTVFAEGSRGHLGRQLIERYKLDADRDPQSYAIGIKELWEVDPAQSHPGRVVHTSGWPLDSDTYGGSFLYHLNDNLVAVGREIGRAHV